MADVTVDPMNHDYDPATGKLTPKPGGTPTDASGNYNTPAPQKFRVPSAESPKHVDPKDGKSKSINDIIDEMG